MRLEPIVEFCVGKGLRLKGFEVLKLKESEEEDLETYFLKASSSVDFVNFLGQCDEVKNLHFSGDLYYYALSVGGELSQKVNLFFNLNLDTLMTYAKEIKEAVEDLEKKTEGKVRAFLEVTERSYVVNGDVVDVLVKDRVEILKKIKEVLGRRIIVDDFGRGVANFDLINAPCEAGIAGIKIDVKVIPFNVCKEVVKYLARSVKAEFFLVIFEKIEDEKTLAKFVKDFFVKESKNGVCSLKFCYQGFVFKKFFKELFLSYKN